MSGLFCSECGCSYPTRSYAIGDTCGHWFGSDADHPCEGKLEWYAERTADVAARADAARKRERARS